MGQSCDDDQVVCVSDRLLPIIPTIKNTRRDWMKRCCFNHGDDEVAKHTPVNEFC